MQPTRRRWNATARLCVIGRRVGWAGADAAEPSSRHGGRVPKRCADTADRSSEGGGGWERCRRWAAGAGGHRRLAPDERGNIGAAPLFTMGLREPSAPALSHRQAARRREPTRGARGIWRVSFGPVTVGTRSAERHSGPRFGRRWIQALVFSGLCCSKTAPDWHAVNAKRPPPSGVASLCRMKR